MAQKPSHRIGLNKTSGKIRVDSNAQLGTIYVHVQYMYKEAYILHEHVEAKEIHMYCLIKEPSRNTYTCSVIPCTVQVLLLYMYSVIPGLGGVKHCALRES